jgi:hypothetical protein
VPSCSKIMGYPIICSFIINTHWKREFLLVKSESQFFLHRVLVQGCEKKTLLMLSKYRWLLTHKSSVWTCYSFHSIDQYLIVIMYS